MKIAVAAASDDVSADVSYYGGRAPFYLIFDAEGRLIESLPNPYLEWERHVGYAVAGLMVEEGIDVFIGGVIGPAMIEELSERGMRCVSTSGPVREAVSKFIRSC
jgi:predicted Fe-Mo cluster-binding NifX family protein